MSVDRSQFEKAADARLTVARDAAEMSIDKHFGSFQTQQEQHKASLLRMANLQKAHDVKDALTSVLDRQLKDGSELTNETVEKIFDTAMNNLVERVDLMLEIAGKGETGESQIDTEGDLQNVMNQVLPYIDGLDVRTLIGPEAGNLFLDGVGEAFDDKEILAKLKDGISLKPEDHTQVAKELLALGDLSHLNLLAPNDANGLVTFGLLNPSDRFEVVATYLKEGGAAENVITMVMANLLTPEQAQTLLSANPEYAKEAARALAPEVLAARDQTVAMLQVQSEHLTRSVGHSSPANAMLSFRGIGSLVLGIYGFATFVANALVNKGVVNPGCALGAAGMLAGSEISHGMGGVLPTLRGGLTQLNQNTSETQAEARDARLQKFETELQSQPLYQELYFYNVDAIHKAYIEKKDGTALTAEDLAKQGVDFARLKLSHPALDVNALIQTWSKWVDGMEKHWSGFSLTTPQEQRSFINDARRGKNLAEYTTTPSK